MSTDHSQRGMGAEDYCTCDRPWPCSLAAARPTTVVEAVEAGARALAGMNGDDPDALCGDKHPEWAHWTDEATAVLEAVGYADLLAEVEELRAEADACTERRMAEGDALAASDYLAATAEGGGDRG